MNEFNQYNNWHKALKNWRNIITITLLSCFAATLFTIAQPLKYRSSMNLLVIQGGKENLDYYTASKSTQYLSDILSQVIYSTSFYDSVMNSGFRITDNFSKSEQKRKKQWQKTIDTRVLRDTGIISVNAYSTKRDQAEQIVQAVSYILKTKHSTYHGSGYQVKVSIIDKPITSNWPVKPNLISNLAIAFLLGIFSSLWFNYLFPEININEHLPLKRKTKYNLKEEKEINEILNENGKKIVELL